MALRLTVFAVCEKPQLELILITRLVTAQVKNGSIDCIIGCATVHKTRTPLVKFVAAFRELIAWTTL